jgi:uncharacterized protein YukE
MSAEVINVEFANLRSSADSLAAKAKALEDYLNQLSQNLAPIKSTWYASGSSAGEACNQAETKLRAATNDIINTISQFSGKVNEAHDLQLALENKNAGYFA